jgi:hypothetical protein
MSDDRFGEDVRAPTSAVAAGRRATKTLAVTVASSVHELRDPDAADSECWVTLYHNIATNPIHFHVGPDTVADPLPDAALTDWILPQATERNYKLGRGETSIALIAAGGAGGNVLAYVSSD